MLKTPFTDEYRSLIRSLVEHRLAQGLSQHDLAEQLCTPQSLVAKIETCERRIDVVEYIIISRALGAAPGAIGDQVASIASASTLTSLA
jgi:transcriptional regulator with XRE-family HTH domain